MKLTTREVLSVPNILSYIRILLIPVFIYLFFHATDSRDYYVIGLIILLSGLTDALDGWIARTFNQITELGKIVDPIADKLTQTAIVACLLFRYPYMWILFILFILKELFMGINGLILLKRGKKLDGAKWFGKVSTAVFYLAMGILITFPNLDTYLITFLMIVTGIFLSISFLMYIPEFLRLYEKKEDAVR
ncbi:CDP-alcohol phosphatidyltransferase family protein [Oceanobacillus alkalisoli]|uniref:CDP-alcohol phosphatidyltransferase family protein n=1 Tax=Oceanobacillus alkalisoli TaxID=2925113 RepID=UPI001EEF7E4B|nr:CDP-alcohol phosphatidyltransferase family protein [Oceanobacillus alkalisoli]MCF3943577.1 CDP-alcohol phosphatidyltransferase family protein [Oceanobacillus alkalisoli]MCG5102842.1 CDP-alcohol phosphatidyltransferase family protein [Oceanobacillus alkalisoli]